MFGQPNYSVYQQPMYNQPQMPPMPEPMMRPQYQAGVQMQYPQQAQPSQNQSIIWVPNAQAANDFIVAPNNAVTLWDMNAPVVYVKKTDASGKPTMTTYDLVERAQTVATPTPTPTIPSAEYVTKKEFEALAATVAAMQASASKEEQHEQPTV